MEVTTVSPYPISPTEDDDLCEVDVTSVAIHSVTLLICLCGLAGNVAVFFVPSLRDYEIRSLAALDFLFLLFTVPSAFLFLVEDMSCSTIMPLLYLSFLFQLSFVSYFWALYWLTPSSAVLYILKLYCCCNFQQRLRWMVFCVHILLYFAFFTVVATVRFWCQSQELEHCRAPLISMYAIILLLFFAPMLIHRTMGIIKAKCGSQQQQQLERRDIVFFFTALFTIPVSLWNFLQHLGYIFVPSQIVILLACIHSSIKPFIYFLAGRCWRACFVESLQNSLQRVFQEQNENTACRNDATTDTVV